MPNETVRAIVCLEKENHRLRDILVLLCSVTPDITREAMRTVAYDAAFNLIPKDVAKFQLKRRSKTEAEHSAAQTKPSSPTPLKEVDTV